MSVPASSAEPLNCLPLCPCHFDSWGSAVFSLELCSVARPSPSASPPAARGAVVRVDAAVQVAFCVVQSQHPYILQPASINHPSFPQCIKQPVLTQILPKIDLQSNIQYSQKNNSLNTILNTCRIYGSARHCSDSFYFKRDWANKRKPPRRKKILQTLNPEPSY